MEEFNEIFFQSGTRNVFRHNVTLSDMTADMRGLTLKPRPGFSGHSLKIEIASD